jgi:glycosyltransferase involved in cell wall biosynthesis
MSNPPTSLTGAGRSACPQEGAGNRVPSGRERFLAKEPSHSLSVAIIARDEQRHIAEALASVAGLADEVVVLLDDRTSDATESICVAQGAIVYHESWRGFPAQRNRALERCRGEWVLFLDADERVTSELAIQIRAMLHTPEPSAISGYWIPRHNLFFGQAVRGGGWYPDHQLRLLRRASAHYDESRLVHEFAQIDGQIAYLGGHLLHVNIEQFAELWRKQRAYAIQEAQTLYLEGRRARWRNLIGAPLREFVRRFVKLGGWRDGALGLLLCCTLAYFEAIKFVHLKGLEESE